MDFDYARYVTLMNEFSNTCGKIRTFRDPEIKRSIVPLCEFLRIAAFEVTVDSANSSSHKPLMQPFFYYFKGTADRKRALKIDETIYDGSVAHYNILPSFGEPDWSEQELEQIRALEKQVAMHSERGYIMKLAEEKGRIDETLEIYLLPYFFEYIGRVMAEGKLDKYGAVYFNLKRFSLVNEYFSRRVADDIMRSYIRGLERSVKGDKCICRVGGDNFVMLYEKADLDAVVEYLLGKRVKLNGIEVNVSATAGYCTITEGVRKPTDVMDRISETIQMARTVYKKPYAFYEPKMAEQKKRMKEIENIFPEAIKNEEFKVYYQPKVRIEDGKIIGAEALCRWVRNGSIVSPMQFIPVLERSSSICVLDFYMLEHVCCDIRRWLDEGRKVVRVSVNLSRMHLGNEMLLENILGIIDRYGVPHEYLEIELTETSADVDFDELKNIVNGLHESNVSTAVDDFGTGFSSLKLITELPWGVLKIDKSFIPEDSNEHSKRERILRHIITMSHDLGMECIAEGVETLDQARLLQQMECYLAQGFYYAKPMPCEDYEKKLMCE